VDDPSAAESITIDLLISGSLASGRLAFTKARVMTMRDGEVFDDARILIVLYADPEALRAATVVGARKLGIDQHVGTIEPGRIADLLIVNGNPLTDLRALLDQWLVVTGGHVSAAPDAGSGNRPAGTDADLRRQLSIQRQQRDSR
jgi:adenine deaminase